MGVIVNFLMATIRRQGPGGHASRACNTVTARCHPPPPPACSSLTGDAAWASDDPSRVTNQGASSWPDYGMQTDIGRTFKVIDHVV